MTLWRLDSDGLHDPKMQSSEIAAALDVRWGALGDAAWRLALGLPAFVEAPSCDAAALASLGITSRASEAPPTVRASAAAADSIARAWTPLRARLEVVAPEALASLGGPALAMDVDFAERRMGAALPEDLVAWLALHDGGAGHGPFDWSLQSVVRALDGKAIYDGLPDPDQPGESDPEIAPVWWHTRWLPLLENGAGDALCVDLAPTPRGTFGQVIEFLHDHPRRRLLARSFADWLASTRDDFIEGRLVATETGDGAFFGVMPTAHLEGSLSSLRARGEPAGAHAARIDAELFGKGIVLLGQALPRLQRAGLVELTPSAAAFTPASLEMKLAIAAALDAAPSTRAAKADALLAALRASAHVTAVRATRADIDAVFEQIASN